MGRSTKSSLSTGEFDEGKRMDAVKGRVYIYSAVIHQIEPKLT